VQPTVYNVEAVVIEDPKEIDLETVTIAELESLLPDKIFYGRVI
jgi:hypothetical protein